MHLLHPALLRTGSNVSPTSVNSCLHGEHPVTIEKVLPWPTAHSHLGILRKLFVELINGWLTIINQVTKYIFLVRIPHLHIAACSFVRPYRFLAWRLPSTGFSWDDWESAPTSYDSDPSLRLPRKQVGLVFHGNQEQIPLWVSGVYLVMSNNDLLFILIVLSNCMPIDIRAKASISNHSLLGWVIPLLTHSIPQCGRVRTKWLVVSRRPFQDPSESISLVLGSSLQ